MQGNIHVSDDVLIKLVTRLENAISKLEGGKATPVNVSSAMLTTEKIAAFTEYWNKTLHLLLALKEAAKETNIPELEQISEIVCEAICAHQDVLIASETFKRPVNNDLQQLSKKIGSITGRVQEIGKAKKEVALHAEAVKNGLDALYWLYGESQCDAITQTYFESIDFAGNKVFMKKVPAETKWVKAFKAIIKEIDELVKANYKVGLTWSSKGDDSISNLLLTIGNTYRKNFKKHEEGSNEKIETESKTTKDKLMEQIGSSDLRASLKPVGKSESQKTEEKKEEKKESQTSPNKKVDDKRGRRETLVKKGKKEHFEESRSSFLYENLDGETKELDPEKLVTRTVVQISNCIGCTFKISKKVNAIKLTNCEEVNIICDSLITMFEIINSVKIQVQVDGTINSFSIDGSTGVLLHLSQKSAAAQFYASKSSEIKIRLTKEEDISDYTELIIPEQFVYTINDKNKIDARVSELYNY
jgi:hypothetical protein